MVPLSLTIVLVAGLGSALAQTQPGNSPAASLPIPGQPASTPKPLTPEMRGDIFMARRMYREAIEMYNTADQKDAAIWNKKGIAYQNLNELDAAKKNYERALKLNPKFAEAQNNIGTVQYSQKSYRSAVNTYKKALRLSPNSASFHKNLGTAYFARKNEKEAMAEYMIAMSLDPTVFEPHSGTGPVLLSTNIEERAKFDYSMAKLYAKVGNSEQALQFLRRALEEGFKDKKKMGSDPEWDAFREVPEFKELLSLEPRVL